MRDLRVEFDRLNDDQKEAVLHLGNTVVLAGPGSGKTDTLVIKVAHLLGEVLGPIRGVACITYNRDTVRELRQRLLQFGFHPGFRLYVGTVHSFCLNCVLRPFGHMVGEPTLVSSKVVTDRQTEPVLQSCLDAERVNQRASWFRATLTRIRRHLACGEDTSGLNPAELRVAVRYEKALKDAGHLDFEGMVLEALKLIEQQPAVRDLIVSRFPWLVVDEYQDLGGPLHHIVVSLGASGAQMFAVGDPDQTIYPFTGAHPRYLEALSKTAGFHTIRLRFNYRSGGRLITASQAALAPDAPRGYEPDPKRTDSGEVYIENVAGALNGQVTYSTWLPT